MYRLEEKAIKMDLLLSILLNHMSESIGFGMNAGSDYIFRHYGFPLLTLVKYRPSVQRIFVELIPGDQQRYLSGRVETTLKTRH